MTQISRTKIISVVLLLILVIGCIDQKADMPKVVDTTNTPKVADTRTNTPKVADTPGSNIPKVIPNTNNPKEIKTIDSSAIKLTVKQDTYGNCKALTPQDWTITSTQDGSGTDLWSSNGNMHAGWSIAFFLYGTFPNEEQLFAFYMSANGYQNYKLSNPYDIGYGYTGKNLETNNKKGLIFYRIFDYPELGGYIVSMRQADSNIDIWESKGSIPSSAAISIRCVTKLRPSPDGSSGSSSQSDEVSMSDKWQEAIMGFENVYSPSIGEHYQAPLNTYLETGPQGPGYYRSLPDGGYEKLNRGFGDY